MPPFQQTPADTIRVPDWRQLDRKATSALISLIIVTGFAAAIAYHYYQGAYGGQAYHDAHIALPPRPPVYPDWRIDPEQYPFLYVGRQYPANTFLFDPGGMFGDFRYHYDVMMDPQRITSRGQPLIYNYFPFAYLCTVPFLLLSLKGATALFLLLFTIAFLRIAGSNLQGPTRFDTWRNAVVFSAFTYPFLFAVDRANNEAVVFLLLYWFVHLVAQARYQASVLPLAMAIASKPFPAIFLVLLFVAKPRGEPLLATARRRGLLKALLELARRNQEIAWTLLASLGLNLVAAIILAKYFAYDPDTLAGWKRYSDLYVIGKDGLAFGHSLWGMLKMFLYYYYQHFGNYSLEEIQSVIFARAARPFMYCMWSLFLGICVYIWRRERTFWKQVALLVFSMNLLPYVSGDYKLLHVFIPLFLFINRKRFERLDITYAVLFALLLIPKNYCRAGATNLGVVLNPAIMLVMTCLIIGSGLLRGKEAKAVGAEVS